MNFLTSSDLKNGRKVLLKGRIVTPISMAGNRIQIAEDGQWHRHQDLKPLAEEQIREELIHQMAALVEGKRIANMKAKGKGVQFVLDDNTRVSLDLSSEGDLKLRVLDPDGQRIL